MIGKITGVVDYRASDHVLIDVRGVGYIVHVSERTLAGLPGPGQPVALYTEMILREDLMQLIGFPTLLDKEWFRLLTTVQGVGAKAALAILGTLGPEGAGRAITLGDARAVQAAPGVGPKLAQRIVLELKSKAPAVMAAGMALAATADGGDLAEVLEAAPAATIKPARKTAEPKAPPPRVAYVADALSALTNLGYATGDAAEAVAVVSGEAPEADTATLIRLALKRLAPKG